MPSSDNPHDAPQPPPADDLVQQKKDLWAAAREIAMARRGQTAPAPPPPPPPKKRRIKLKAPPIARSQTEEPVLDEELPPGEAADEEVPEAATPLIEAEPEPVIPTAKEVPASAPKTEEHRIEKKADAQPPKDTLTSDSQAKPKKASKTDDTQPESKDDDTPEDKEATPLSEEEQKEAAAKARREKLLTIWRTIGGESLSLSLGIHVLIIIAGTLLYVTYNREERIDFLPGGGTRQGEDASRSVENKVTRKKNQWLNKKVPMQRIAVQNAMSQITLPDQDPVLDLPMTRDFMTAGKMGGGGFGDGSGLGAKGGITFKPITLFGREIIGKKLAVVLDVSYSMTPYLQDVVKEVDRVARGSPVILYYGCGLDRPPTSRPLNERAYRTQERSFEKFWRFLREDPSKPPGQLPNADVYNAFARRNNTYYVDHNGTEYAWTALLNEILRNADALYWFCDFEDTVNDKQISIVKENLDLRKQRLYIHPQKRGFSFEKVRDELAIPSGGDVVEPKAK